MKPSRWSKGSTAMIVLGSSALGQRGKVTATTLADCSSEGLTSNNRAGICQQGCHIRAAVQEVIGGDGPTWRRSGLQTQRRRGAGAVADVRHHRAVLFRLSR